MTYTNSIIGKFTFVSAILRWKSHVLVTFRMVDTSNDMY